MRHLRRTLLTMPLPEKNFESFFAARITHAAAASVNSRTAFDALCVVCCAS